MATLDPRLLSASEMIIPRGAVADIGTDHGQLPIYLINSGLSPYVIATEWGDGPYQRAWAKIEHLSCTDRIEVRQGYGLEALEPGEVETVVLMGMGGDLLAEIISRDWRLTASFARLVLQPMTRPAVLRRLMAHKGWPLVEERVVKVRGRFFVLMSYAPGEQGYPLSVLQAEVGPQILQRQGETELDYLTYCQSKFERLAAKLSLSNQARLVPKLKQYQTICKDLEDIINGKTG